MKRVIRRDVKERGKDKKQALNDFLKSWSIYYKKFKPNSIKNNKNKFIIEKNTEIDLILKDYLIKSLIFFSNIKALKIEPSILPNPSPSNQSPQNPILYFLLNCKDNGTARPEGCEALHFIIDIFTIKS